MRAAGGGSVVMVASQLAFGGGRLNAAYIASKGAIVSLVKTAGFELAPDNAGQCGGTRRHRYTDAERQHVARRRSGSGPATIRATATP